MRIVTRGSTDEEYYQLTDVQFSTIAVIDDSANLVERVVYEAYGQARHRWQYDVDGDGDEDSNDLLIAQTAGFPTSRIGVDALYNPDADFDRDGDVDKPDVLTLNGALWRAALPAGEISDATGPDNPFVFTGFVYNTETNHSLARNRYYDPYAGRWLEHDPVGYADGMSLYQYVRSSPTIYEDPYGYGPGDWLPSFSDIVHGRTLLYQMTPSVNEFISGKTIARQVGDHILHQSVATTATEIGAGVKDQFYDRSVQGGNAARRNAQAAGAGYWESSFRGAAVGVGSFFGYRDMYEGQVGTDILTGNCLSAAEQSKRVLGGAAQFVAILSAPAAASRTAAMAANAGRTAATTARAIANGLARPRISLGRLAGSVSAARGAVRSSLRQSRPGFAGQRPVLARGMRHSPDQAALVKLVNETTNYGKKALSRLDAETIMDWAQEYSAAGFRAGARDLATPSNWRANPVPHFHLSGTGAKGHIPVEIGVRPR